MSTLGNNKPVAGQVPEEDVQNYKKYGAIKRDNVDVPEQTADEVRKEAVVNGNREADNVRNLVHH